MTNFGANTNGDSLDILALEVIIKSIDNPSQPINISHIVTDKYPDISGNVELLRAPNFNNLPDGCKIFSEKIKWRSYRFRFDTPAIDRSKYYQITIKGLAIYKGKSISFEKIINGTRKKDYVPYRMMT